MQRRLGVLAMTPIPLIRTSSILPMLGFLERIGAPVERCLQEIGLPISTATDPETLIPIYSAFTFIEKMARREGIDHLGIVVSQQVEFRDMGSLPMLVLQSLTLYEAIATISRLVTTTYNSGARVWLTQQQDLAWLNHQFLNPAQVNNQQSQYFTCLTYLKLIQMVAGPAWQPAALHMQAEPLPGLTDHPLFGTTQVRFNQPHNAIAFPKKLLSLPLQHLKSRDRQPDPGNLYQQIQTNPPASDLAGSLQQLIQLLLTDRSLNIHVVAAATGSSIRSFQRELAAHNLSYSRLVDKVRFDLAVKRLLNTPLPITEIAYDLGYTDVANFTRAFKRWAGVSPREFRHQHQAKFSQ
ncbi:MAG: AraC family transcriptional regulator ligand-binding domain-containing protein [Leptolyngbyaceae cyanobacterium bins.349]|nr:AraC family transcriptional regulator ligand-binding domain-containing protein [Leptolyngbyaceae cyanobacterium bins.349]